MMNGIVVLVNEAYEIWENSVTKTNNNDEFVKSMPKFTLGRHLTSVISKIEVITHLWLWFYLKLKAKFVNKIRKY